MTASRTPVSSNMAASEHTAAMEDIIREHFLQAEQRVDTIYRTHFASFGATFKRHWRHKRDIPGDLLVLPRMALHGGQQLIRGKPVNHKSIESGKQAELRIVIEEQLLALPELEQKLENYCQNIIQEYQQDLERQTPLSDNQRQEFQNYLQYQLNRLNLPHEGIREGLLAFTIMLSGKLLGDKAILSSAASLGGTLASTVYIGQQGWLGALWASWMGAPGWVGFIGASTGVLALLLLSPMLAPGIEWSINRLRSRRILRQTVQQAEQQLLNKDGILMISRLGIYLQLLPDITQFVSRLK